MESPEAKAMGEFLADRVCALPVERIDVPAGRWQANVLLLNCAGNVIQSIRTHGNWLFFDFAHGVSWAQHMVARAAWRLEDAAAPRRQRPTPHGRGPLLDLALRGGVRLTLWGRPLLLVLPTGSWREHPELTPRALGPDPLAADYQPEELVPRLAAAAGRTLAAALLDPAVVAGIGNRLKCEILFAARLAPATRIGALYASDLTALGGTLRTVLQRFHAAARAAGVGERSGPARPYAVYDRAGEPCVVCHTPIVVDRTGSDSHETWYCPACQAPRAGPQSVLF